MFSNYRKDVASFHAGLRPNEYYQAKALKAASDRARDELKVERRALDRASKRLRSNRTRLHFDLSPDQFADQIDALVADGVCDAETIDDVVKSGFGARMAVLGPMEQSDLVGLNLTLDIHEALIQHLDRTAGPHPFLRSKVAQGKLGMKTGEGFRRWTPQQAEEVRERLRRFLADQAKVGEQNDHPLGGTL